MSNWSEIGDKSSNLMGQNIEAEVHVNFFGLLQSNTGPRPHCSPSRRKEIASWLVIVATANVHEDEEEKGKETIPTHPPNNTRTMTSKTRATKSRNPNHPPNNTRTMTSKMRATKSRNPNQRADWWWDAQSVVCRIGSTQELWQVVSMILHLRTYPFQHIFFSCPSQWHTLRFDLLQLIEGF